MIYAAMLRAVNVGGTSKLAMSDLRALCEGAQYEGVRTYIQSGNVVFRAKDSAKIVQSTLERGLAVLLGKPCRVHVRTGKQLHALLDENPFAAAPGNRVALIFLDQAPTASELAAVKHQTVEAIAPRGSHVWVHYPDGMGRSKLTLPFAKAGTARNVNTVQKLAELCDALQ